MIMSKRVIFTIILLIGVFLVSRGATLLYMSQKAKTAKDKQKELDLILEREVLNTKANVQQVSYDDILTMQFKQQPSKIYENMFEQDPFRIGL